LWPSHIPVVRSAIGGAANESTDGIHRIIVLRHRKIAYGIPPGIKREHVERAAEDIARDGIPSKRKSDRFEVVVGNASYPAKYVISISAWHAFGEELSSSRFHAHQAVRYLGKAGLGYKIKDRLAAAANDVVVEDDEFAFPEGRARYRLHRKLERKPQISAAAKRKRLQSSGKLECDVCTFDFTQRYGVRGQGFIEAHHTIPVSELDGTTKTKIADLALVCSNCHRMLHRDPLLTVKELRRVVRSRESK
jgi:predicted HNH restriction endonuclease